MLICLKCWRFLKCQNAMPLSHVDIISNLNVVVAQHALEHSWHRAKSGVVSGNVRTSVSRDVLRATLGGDLMAGCPTAAYALHDDAEISTIMTCRYLHGSRMKDVQGAGHKKSSHRSTTGHCPTSRRIFL